MNDAQNTRSDLPNGTATGAQAPTLSRTIALALLGGLSMFCAVQLAGAARAGWVFEYPLDDVYIHLSMAAEIARGGYGVNAGEYASAASSPLYPVLLTLAPETELQRLLPLFWNIVGLCLSCILWALILARAGLSRAWATGLAIAGPIATGSFAAAFAGMEHSLHAAASLAIVYGMLRLVQSGTISAVLIAGIVLAPLFRFEGAALALIASCLIIVSGRRRVGVLMVGLSLVPLIAFCFFLTRLGLDPLPNSVLAKLPDPSLIEGGRLARFWASFQDNLAERNGQALLLIGVSAALLPWMDTRLRQGLWPLFGAAIGIAALAHLVLSDVGWMDRYEHYALISLAAGSIALAAHSGRSALIVLACLPLLMSGLTYLSQSLRLYPVNPRAIHLQQAQMGRFVQDHYQAPVAINDLGRVVWGNDAYVLDLWGLANDKARKTRQSRPAAGWGGDLADARDVKLALIYTDWLGSALGADWTHLGNLTMEPMGGTLGSHGGVDFYAQDAETAQTVRPMLEAWAKDLPQGASFISGDVQ